MIYIKYMNYKAIIGIEVHAELLRSSAMIGSIA
jgi:Asp-tRNA(Asn)/Glu-tRNA(Gln) amidotransferase B subunit